MKFKFLWVKSSKTLWADQATDHYIGKIKSFVPVDECIVKPYSASRDSSEKKKEIESQKLSEKIDSADFVILLDEKGRNLNTIEFKKILDEHIFLTNSNVTIVIGGVYGVNESLKKKANIILSLSKFTLNNHVARVSILEQVYRALTLIKGIPYHNI